MINGINILNCSNVGLDNCDMKSSDRLMPSCDELVLFSTDDDRLSGGSSVGLVDRVLESHLGG